MKHSKFVLCVIALVLLGSFALSGCGEKAATLQAIGIASLPHRTIYDKGETTDLSGLQVEATYSDGTKKTLNSSDYTTDCAATFIDACTVTVTYDSKTATFKLNLSAYTDAVKAIENKYAVASKQGQIVFYGASNFALWANMENDLGVYKVQNHGFGGSTDEYLYNYANRLIYAYNPKIVFFQTGSNDYVNLSGTDEEKIAKCMAYKDTMFQAMHVALPDAMFVVMSGLILPGRKAYADLTMKINTELATYCENNSFMKFVDATQMTYSVESKRYNYAIFNSDEIHLNESGQKQWAEGYIKPAIESVIAEKNWSDLRK